MDTGMGMGMGFGFASFLPYIIGALVLMALLRSRSGGPPMFQTLVLRKFHVSQSPEDGAYVEIVGRAQGIVGWLLTVMGVDSTTYLRVTALDICKRSASLAGEQQDYLPLVAVGRAQCGYVKPLAPLFLGVLLVLLGIAQIFSDGKAIQLVVYVFFGGLLLVYYWLNKKFVIAIESAGGSWLGVTFKRSVIENVALDFDKCIEVIDTINRLVRDSRNTDARPDTVRPATARSAPAPASAAPPRAAPTAAPAATGKCGSCGTLNPAGSRFCENCGGKL